eukprot:TRINITY_DN3802_c0_g1_i3.p1 TRINITY_DN3802_c0_g1~~TRINITY_DN3802_c0_g1_i3.p1  ORF type:complete len:330 (+),score=12.39 TRINITY_DN3802_c0_g1_i3:438-1427(+)
MFLAYVGMLFISFSVVILHKGVLKGIWSLGLAEFVHYIMIILIFVGSISLTIYLRFPPTQNAYVLFQMVLVSMKMHSYIRQNRVYYLEYKSNPNKSEYPSNVTYSNWFVFFFMPTVVYCVTFPRTPRVRPLVVIKTLITVAWMITIIFLILSEFVLPYLRRANELPFFHLLSALSIPCMALYVLFFFFVFEVILNGFAEITRFADRHFYEDWWNSTGYDEFARKWNRPIHSFLKLHVYNRMVKADYGRTSALLTTFFLSAVVHELLMAVAFRVFTIWVFSLMMLELIFIFTMARFKGSQGGNLLWWFLMFCGTPLLAVLYAREYYIHQV